VDKVDYELRRMSANSKNHIKYVSFKHSSKAERVAGVKLNQLLNVKLKYEFLEDTAVLADAEFNGKKNDCSTDSNESKNEWSISI